MRPTTAKVARARGWYLDFLKRRWWYSRGWDDRTRNMILWYSVAGTAVLGEGAANTILDDAIRGKKLPGTRGETWRQAKVLSNAICEKKSSNAVDWFTGGCGCVYTAWESLDDVKNIGPKIASWFMRDLSLMRDYSDGRSGRQLAIRQRADRSWYERLPLECQALYVPIDVWVHKGAKFCGVGGLFRKHDAVKMQLDPNLHVDAAMQIVSWSHRNGYDPREMDIYWYGAGSGKSG